MEVPQTRLIKTCTFWLLFRKGQRLDIGPYDSKKTWAQASGSAALTPNLSQPWQNARESSTVSSPSPYTASPVGAPSDPHPPFPRSGKCFLLTSTSVSIQREFKWRHESPQIINHPRHCSPKDTILGSKRNGFDRSTFLCHAFNS